jgi:hypothetical protein
MVNTKKPAELLAGLSEEFYDLVILADPHPEQRHGRRLWSRLHTHEGPS